VAVERVRQGWELSGNGFTEKLAVAFQTAGVWSLGGDEELGILNIVCIRRRFLGDADCDHGSGL